MTHGEPPRDEVRSDEVEAGRKGGEAAMPMGAARAVPVAAPYAIDWPRLFGAGFVATVVITLMLYLLPPRLDVATALGSIVVPQGGAAAFWVGMVWHFINGSILFPAIGAGILLALRLQSAWHHGLWLGALLWLLGPMLLMPLATGQRPFALAAMGWGAVAWNLIDHLVYGAVAGALYRHRVR